MPRYLSQAAISKRADSAATTICSALAIRTLTLSRIRQGHRQRCSGCHNREPSMLHLEVKPPHIDSWMRSGIIALVRTGDRRPFEARALRASKFAGRRGAGTMKGLLVILA